MRTAKRRRICAEQERYLKNKMLIYQGKTQDVVQNRFAAYYSEKFIIYKWVIVMYNKVSVKLGKVALEGIRRGMLS